jgi:hypothetical protein
LNVVEISKNHLDEQWDWAGFVNPPSTYANQVAFYAGIACVGDSAPQCAGSMSVCGPGEACWFPSSPAVADAIGVVGGGVGSGWTRAFYPQNNPLYPNKMGESFAYLHYGVGLGVYAQSYGFQYRPQGTGILIYPKNDVTQGVAIARNFDEYHLAPWTGAQGTLRIKIINVEMKTAAVGSTGQCRFDFTAKLTCAGCNPHRGTNVMVRAGSVGNNMPEGGVSLANSLQYNIKAGPEIRNGGPGGEVVATSNGADTATGVRAPATIDVNVTWDQYKIMLEAMAIQSGATGSSDEEKAESYFGAAWDDVNAWKVKGVSSRMEVTQDGTNKTRCGGSFVGYRLERL